MSIRNVLWNTCKIFWRWLKGLFPGRVKPIIFSCLLAYLYLAMEFIILYFSLFWVSIAACGPSLDAVSEGLSLVVAYRLLIAMASLCCRSQVLEHHLSNCSTWALLLRGMWNLPRPSIKPVSPALAGGFLATGPPRKSLAMEFKSSSYKVEKLPNNIYASICICKSTSYFASWFK